MSEECKARSPQEEGLWLCRAVQETLRWERGLGFPGVDREKLEAARRRRTSSSGRRNPGEDLREIRAELGDCKRCELWKGRTNIVFGDGDPYAKLMFVGEGPGADEDAQGVPFVGKAGQLLTDIIEKGMKIKRNEVYIANVVKCRPPQNRDPLPEEQATCLPFLKKQIAALQPKVIVTLGKIATHALLGPQAPISRLRGEWRDYEGVALMPTFHPSYLLHNPGEKRLVWEDIKKVMERLGIPVEGKK